MVERSSPYHGSDDVDLLNMNALARTIIRERWRETLAFRSG